MLDHSLHDILCPAIFAWLRPLFTVFRVGRPLVGVLQGCLGDAGGSGEDRARGVPMVLTAFRPPAVLVMRRAMR